METKELKIEVPEGFEIDKENSSFEKIVFKKKDTKPRSWEEYCKQQSRKNETGYFIDATADIHACSLSICDCNIPETWRNVLPSKELAEAFLAMMQLMSLRQAWIHQWSVERNLPKDWKPNWLNNSLVNYCIEVDLEEIDVYPSVCSQVPLSFPTNAMAEEFMYCFKDLLEIAKPLL